MTRYELYGFFALLLLAFSLEWLGYIHGSRYVAAFGYGWLGARFYQVRHLFLPERMHGKQVVMASNSFTDTPDEAEDEEEVTNL